MKYLQVSNGGIQPVQPGPGCGAGIDTPQLLTDGGEEGTSPLEVIQKQDHTVVTHWRQGRAGTEYMGEPGITETTGSAQETSTRVMGNTELSGPGKELIRKTGSA